MQKVVVYGDCLIRFNFSSAPYDSFIPVLFELVTYGIDVDSRRYEVTCLRCGERWNVTTEFDNPPVVTMETPEEASDRFHSNCYAYERV